MRPRGPLLLWACTLLFGILKRAGGAVPDVCVAAWDPVANAFVEDFEYDLETMTSPQLHMFLCEYATNRDCKTLQVSLLPSGASQSCFDGSYKGELQVMSPDPGQAPIVKHDFFGNNQGSTLRANDQYSSRCQGYSAFHKSDYYGASTGPACVDHSDDETFTAAELFPGLDSKLHTPILDTVALPDCAVKMALCLRKRSKFQWRTVDPFAVSGPGRYTYQVRGFTNKISAFHSVDADDEVLAFTVWAKSCAPGHERAESDRSCVPCPQGKYKAGYGETCSNCVAGKYGIAAGQASAADGCQNCPAGKFLSAKGATSSVFCQDCDAGNYCPANQLNTHATGGSNTR